MINKKMFFNLYTGLKYYEILLFISIIITYKSIKPK